MSNIPDEAAMRMARDISRLRAQTLLSWEKEKRMLAWWGLQDGMAVLEVGSGPGFFTEQLLTQLPSSAITCIDNNAAFLTQARQILSEEARQRVQFVEASILDSNLPENTFDVAIVRFVFQHLAAPVVAMQAIWRLLKPGGKIIIIDSDDDLFGIVYPAIPMLTSMLEKYGQAQARRGGNRQLGKHLWRLLAQAGFQALDLETLAFHSDKLGIEAFYQHMDPRRFVPLIKAGLLTEQEFAQADAAFEAFLASPERLILLLWLMLYGEKPRTAL